MNLSTRIENNIAWITIEKEKALNALDVQLIQDIGKTIAQINRDKSAQCIVLKGSGNKAFAAGADIKEFVGKDSSEGLKMTLKGHDVFDSIEASEIPVIAAVDGYALGGGFELALACHIIICTEEARFGFPEINLGIIPGYGGTVRFIEITGKSNALFYILTGNFISSQKALSLGIVSDVVKKEDFEQAITDLASQIASKHDLAVQANIRQVNLHLEHLKSSLKQEADEFGRLFDSLGFKQGVSEFISKEKINRQILFARICLFLYLIGAIGFPQNL